MDANLVQTRAQILRAIDRERPRQLTDRAVELLDDAVERRRCVRRDRAVSLHVARLQLLDRDIDEREMCQQRVAQAEAVRPWRETLTVQHADQLGTESPDVVMDQPLLGWRQIVRVPAERRVRLCLDEGAFEIAQQPIDVLTRNDQPPLLRLVQRVVTRSAHNLTPRAPHPPSGWTGSPRYRK